VDRLLGALGIQQDTPEGRQEFQGRLEARRHAEEAEDALSQIRYGWCFGSAQFRQELLDQFASTQGEHQTGELRLENAQSRAERIIAEELAALGWTDVTLSTRAKNDPAKLAIGARLRRETILSTKEIAARLQLGTSKSATTALHRWMRSNPLNSDSKRFSNPPVGI